MSETTVPDVPETLPTSRRAFLRKGAVAAVTLPTASALLSACAGETPAPPTKTTSAGAATPPVAAPRIKSPAERAAAMDAMHEKGIKAFPAKTAVMGNQPLAPKLVGGVKVFELTAKRMKWETAPGQFVDAMAFNEQVPGPQIRCREGDRVRIVVTNELDQSTAVHFHGLEVPNDQDGVPFITQPPIKPGETHTYEFTVPNAGSHMYHSHHNSAYQTPMGLLGAFLVEPKRPARIEKADLDYTMILNDGMHGFTLNGKSFPATEPIKAKLGQKVRIRYMNEGSMIHPMHLHGMHMTVFAKDGWLQPQPWKCDTLNIAPGERWDVIVECTNPGVWAFHCHILSHAESEHGMFGMVTALIVEK
ncbi:MAG TPA: copper oxidase [Gemmatimonadales bacterium]|nr:copper oxidase [Gemmatimonadales bacterium]